MAYTDPLGLLIASPAPTLPLAEPPSAGTSVLGEELAMGYILGAVGEAEGLRCAAAMSCSQRGPQEENIINMHCQRLLTAPQSKSGRTITPRAFLTCTETCRTALNKKCLPPQAACFPGQ